jgi:plastocyanin domain-containing protein
MRTPLLVSIAFLSLAATGCPQTATTPAAASSTPAASPAGSSSMTTGSSGTTTMTHTTSASAAPKSAPVLDAYPDAKAIKVTASAKGFSPDVIHAKKGEPIALELVRTDDKTCATEAVFPSLGIDAKLPLNQPVRVSFKPDATGDVAFACGMGMFHGKVVVAAK